VKDRGNVFKIFFGGLLVSLAVIILVETSMRIFAAFDIFSNIHQGIYISPYDQRMDTWYFLEQPNSEVIEENDEFSYTYRTNEQGALAYKRKDSADLNILVMGDSYSFGIGAPQDSSWAVQLMALLEQKTGKTINLVNASKPGSDPFFSYLVYRDKLSHLHFDIILLGINSSDLYEVYARGGYERFKEDGSTQTKKAPWHATIYKYFYLGRYLLKKALKIENAYLYSENNIDELIYDAQEVVGDCLFDFKALAESKKGLFVPFVFALPWEIIYKQKDRVLTLEDRAALSDNRISIRDCMAEYYHSHNIEEYYWPQDRHYNSNGYRVMAECVSNQLLPFFQNDESN
jgi:hypothetical protein